MKKYTDGTKCAPKDFPEYRSWSGKYWRKEVHISIPLVTVIRDISNKLINRLKEEKSCAELNTVGNGRG